MADLFHTQAKQYSETRPTYPPELFNFIASKTPCHDLVWDVGTGSGQAAASLAEIYKSVVGTDTSQKQLDFAVKTPNVRYQQTPPNISLPELERVVSARATVDLVTVAQALHWFDLPTFYEQVNFVLKKPNGVIAVWCYTIPIFNDAVDAVFRKIYSESRPYWEPARKLVDDQYKTIDFPFEPVEGEDHTGPFEFEAKRTVDLESFCTYIKSWSAYQTALKKGVELLRDDVVEDLKSAWEEDGNGFKVIRYPVFLMIGRVRA